MENNNNDDFISPYEVLGIDVNCNIYEVKQAFSKMAKITHPDKHGGDDEFFNLVYKSYKIIKEEKKKLEERDAPKNIDSLKYDKIINDELGDDFHNFENNSDNSSNYESDDNISNNNISNNKCSLQDKNFNGENDKCSLKDNNCNGENDKCNLKDNNDKCNINDKNSCNINDKNNDINNYSKISLKRKSSKQKKSNDELENFVIKTDSNGNKIMNAKDFNNMFYKYKVEEANDDGYSKLMEEKKDEKFEQSITKYDEPETIYDNYKNCYELGKTKITDYSLSDGKINCTDYKKAYSEPEKVSSDYKKFKDVDEINEFRDNMDFKLTEEEKIKLKKIELQKAKLEEYRKSNLRKYDNNVSNINNRMLNRIMFKPN